MNKVVKMQREKVKNAKQQCTKSAGELERIADNKGKSHTI